MSENCVCAVALLEFDLPWQEPHRQLGATTSCCPKATLRLVKSRGATGGQLGLGTTPLEQHAHQHTHERCMPACAVRRGEGAVRCRVLQARFLSADRRPSRRHHFTGAPWLRSLAAAVAVATVAAILAAQGCQGGDMPLSLCRGLLLRVGRQHQLSICKPPLDLGHRRALVGG